MPGASDRGPMVWFVRHAESIWNEAGLVQGQADAPGLSAAGTLQAEQLAVRLAGCGAGAVLSSDLLRAMETARPIAARLSVPVTSEPMLRERDLGAAQGRPTTSLVPSESGYDGTVVVDPDARPAGGESLRQLYQRVGRCLEELRRSPLAPAMVVVTHGGFLRAARAWLAGTAVDAMGWTDEPNAEVWQVDLGRDRTRIEPSRQRQAR